MTGRRTLDLSLYLVADVALSVGRDLPRTVRAAAHAGVTAVQLRAPAEATDDDVVALGRELRTALRGSGVPLVVNDRVHLVHEIGADGAHVGQSDLEPGAARSLLGPGPFLGLSVRSAAELAAARRLPAGTVDHLGVGPVWATATKPDHVAPGGPERVRRLAAASPWPCVAIGGITAERVPRLRGTGAAGIAVAGALCRARDVAAETRRLRHAWEGTP